MGAVASLNLSAVSVEPGAEATIEIKVRNSGTVVDQFTLDVVGAAAAWAIVTPPSLNLLPGTEGVAAVSFRPPRSTDVAAGVVPFGVRVVSQQDAEGSTTEEGTVEVLPFRELYAELTPRTTRGRREGRTELAIDNRGNQPLNADLSATDPNEALLFHFSPPGLVAGPNTAAFSKLGVRARKSFLRGTPKTHVFQVLVATPSAPPVAVDGVMLQEPLLPKWFFKALLALLALLVLGAILWLTVLKPAIKSEAKKAVAGPLASQAAAQQALAANQAALGAAVNKLGGSPVPLASVGPTASPTPTTVSPLGDPFRLRLPTSATFPAGQTHADSYTVPANSTLNMADILLENPAGDTGTLTILQDGNPLLVENLDNFRDLDYHFVSPPQFTAGQKLIMSVNCGPTNGAQANPPVSNRACTPSVFVSGFLKTTTP